MATVIDAHALRPRIAVVWSGFLNLLGDLTSTGAAAFRVVLPLPAAIPLSGTLYFLFRHLF